MSLAEACLSVPVRGRLSDSGKRRVREEVLDARMIQEVKWAEAAFVVYSA